MKNAVLTAVLRMDKTHLQSFASSSDHPRHPRLDEQLNAKQMLDKIANFQPSPQTPAYLTRFLRCLVRLQPDNALTPSTNSRNVKLRLKRDSRTRYLMLDLEPIIKELGISHKSAITYLAEARKILTQTFNPDGTLFLTKSKPASKRR